MAKADTSYLCDECGAVSLRWQGQCSECMAWNTLREYRVKSSKSISKRQSHDDLTPVPLRSVDRGQAAVLPTSISELDHVLGGGLVGGSVTLLGGEPGIGKSTLALQLAMYFASQNTSVLYVSGEESLSQLSRRAERLGDVPETLHVLSELDMGRILTLLEERPPSILILDSIQVVHHPDISSVSGTVSQVRHCAQALIQVAKYHHISVIMIGHITKDGGLAGPKVLEHLVDVILVLEGERDDHFRVLRSFKNRYASTREIGLFDMRQEGLFSVSHPETLFLDDTTLSAPGSVVAAVCEGSRVFLVEVQALVVPTGYGLGKRTFLGVDPNRANVMISALEKMLKLPLSQRDIMLNIVGGLKVSEPALDLAIVIAILSSFRDCAIGHQMAVFGEVGLTGEIRPVSNTEKRVRECQSMGFSTIIIPSKPEAMTIDMTSVRRLSNLRDVVAMLTASLTPTTV